MSTAPILSVNPDAKAALNKTISALRSRLHEELSAALRREYKAR